ncbi:hypothetical protein F5Y13DRAFT_177531 [Hypoxylon sp. FL1857]|nr:hypothetical protein F5Y13DRAFT_177531 [Hypoxylon sp. FL1857]
MPAQPTTPTPASPARGYHYTDPRLVHTAQPWAYWSGRYMSLRDKFLNEILQPENLNTVLTADSERNKLAAAAAAKPKPSTSSNTGLTASSTTSHLPARPSALDPTPAMITAANLTDDDMRDLRIFMHLEGVCTTDDARDSLYDFQAAYARSQKKEWLLPRGGAMDPKGKGKGWVGRMFSGGKDGAKKSGGSGSR